MRVDMMGMYFIISIVVAIWRLHCKVPHRCLWNVATADCRWLIQPHWESSPNSPFTSMRHVIPSLNCSIEVCMVYRGSRSRNSIELIHMFSEK